MLELGTASTRLHAGNHALAEAAQRVHDQVQAHRCKVGALMTPDTGIAHIQDDDRNLIERQPPLLHTMTDC